MSHHTTKEELKLWAEATSRGDGHGVFGDDLINLIRDASQLHDLDEIHDYMRKQNADQHSPEDWTVMLAQCATDCADKDYDIAKRDKEIADLKKRIVELEADKPN